MTAPDRIPRSIAPRRTGLEHLKEDVGRHIRLDCVIKPIKHLGVPMSDELDLNGRERLD